LKNDGDSKKLHFDVEDERMGWIDDPWYKPNEMIKE
jgi:hypothetical protein